MDDNELLCVVKTLLLIDKGLERLRHSIDHIGPHLADEVSRRGLTAKAMQMAADLDKELNNQPHDN